MLFARDQKVQELQVVCFFVDATTTKWLVCEFGDFDQK